MFFWNSLAFSMIQQMLAIWSLVPLPFLKPAWTSESSQFTYCWSLAWRILSVTLLAYRNLECQVRESRQIGCGQTEDVSNVISGSSAFSKTSLNIWKLNTVHVLLKPGLENFDHYFTSVWDECNCAVVWAFFGIAFLWDWNENWPFPVLWPLLSFLHLLAYWVQHFHSIIFQDLK